MFTSVYAAGKDKPCPQMYHTKSGAACNRQSLPAGHQGSLLSCIGNNLLELQDVQVEEETVCDASFRWQLCEEEDVRFSALLSNNASGLLCHVLL
jgi:hypothetical protein